MSGWDSSDAQESKDKVMRDLQRRAERGEAITKVAAPTGKKLATQFWGLAWQQHLEAFADIALNLPAGRSYLRQGKVYNLTIEPGLVTAEVAGSSLYEVQVRLTPLKQEHWEDIKQACAGQVSSLLDLLAGKVGPGVMRTITDREDGLFPTRKEIRIQCSCPDYADLCKHSAAVLYAIGLEFDARPEMFFRLRGVDHSELVSAAENALQPATDDVVGLSDDLIAELFGLDPQLTHSFR